MEQFFEGLIRGGAELADPLFIMVAAVGTIWGIVGGAMPGTSASLTVGIALPFTFLMTPPQAVAFIMAILVGANFGNSMPAVLLGVPGTPSAILTAQEGFLLHKRGESGLALGMTYVATMIGQVVSILFFIALVIPLANLAYLFLAPEIFAMSLLGLTAVIGVSGKSVVKGVAAGALGVALSTVGLDPINNVARFTFGTPELRHGLNIIAVIIGLLAVSELFRSMRQVFAWQPAEGKFKVAFPGFGVVRRHGLALTTGTITGCVIGLLPGASADTAAYLAYQQAKNLSKRPSEFGDGSTEGLAANESAQQACQAGQLIPTLAVGIPGGATMVLVLAAVSLHGLIPGPLLLTESPELLYGSVGGLLGATALLALVGWPLSKGIVRLATMDRSIVMSVALLLALVGVYSIRQSLFDVGLTTVFGVVGYFMVRYGYSVAAAALGVILGPNLESGLRQGLLLSDRSIVQFATRPITALILTAALAAFAWGVYSERRHRRAERARAGSGA